MLFLGISTSATTDSSNTSTDRDSSVAGNFSIPTNNRAIASLQQSSFETVLMGRNITNEETGIGSATTKLTHAQQETDVNDAVSNVVPIEEEPTTMPSAKRVVTDDATLILANDQGNQYPIVHTQDHSIGETIPTEAQDFGCHEIPNSTFKTTFTHPPVDQPNLVNRQPSLESAG